MRACGHWLHLFIFLVVTLLSFGSQAAPIEGKCSTSFVSSSGNYGGVRRVTLYLNGEPIEAVKKVVVGTPERIQVILEMYVLAGKLGLAPKILHIEKIRQGKRSNVSIYMELIGDGITGDWISAAGLKLPHPVYMWRPFTHGTYLDEALDTIGPIKNFRSSDFMFDVKDYIFRKPILKKIEMKIKEIENFHPDFHDENVVLKLFRTEMGDWNADVFGVDWEHPHRSVQELKKFRDRLAKRYKELNPGSTNF